MVIVRTKISNEDLRIMAEKMFGGLVKAVVDIEKDIMAVDAELHADLEAALLEEDSGQDYLWGINIFPGRYGHPDYIAFDSMINLRPWQNNRTRGVEDPAIREKIVAVVNKLVVHGS